MTGRRAGALVALGVALIAYGAAAQHFPGLPSGLDVLFQAAVVLPVFAATIWLALPLSCAGTRPLLGAAVAAGLAAVGLMALGADSSANVAKLACYTLLGFVFLTLFEELWWISLVAFLVPWVDVWSVVAGPTEYIVEQQPGIFERVAVSFPSPGEEAAVNVGPPDILFFALFLAAADRFGLRVGWTWIATTGALAVTLILIWTWDDIPGLPALPAVCLGFLLPNADLLWRDARAAWARRS